MAGQLPVADAITPTFPQGQSYLKPGQSMTVTVTGHDADARTVTLTGAVTDASGNVSAGVTFDLVIQDPITYQLTAPQGSGVTVTPVQGQPGKFTVTA